MRLTTIVTAHFLGCTLFSCNENQPPKSEPTVKGNSLLQALQEGKTTYSSNVAPGQMAPARRELNLPGAAGDPHRSGRRQCPDRTGRAGSAGRALDALTAPRSRVRIVSRDGTDEGLHHFQVAVQRLVRRPQRSAKARSSTDSTARSTRRIARRPGQTMTANAFPNGRMRPASAPSPPVF